MRWISHELLIYLAGSYVLELSTRHTSPDRRIEWWAVSIRTLRRQAIGDDRGEGAGPLARLSRLGHGRARTRPRGRAERDWGRAPHYGRRVQRPVPLGLE